MTTLYTFVPPGGVLPAAPLVQALNGYFYGTTQDGGDDDKGTIFRMSQEGVLEYIHTFAGNDGQNPVAGLIQASDGNLYGTTSGGGTEGCGTVYKITAAGALTTLYGFGNSDGAEPLGGLVQGLDGALYGTTSEGGNTGCMYGCGTVFKIALTGQLTTLHFFDGSDGGKPVGGLIQATDGKLYGTTNIGGTYGYGTIFAITAEGSLSTLYNFCTQTDCADGSFPTGGLLQATDGNFYGTTQQGGLGRGCSNCGTVFRLFSGLAPFVAFVRAAGKVSQTGGILGQGFTGATNVSLNGIPAEFAVKSDTFIEATIPAGATTGYVTVTTPTGVLTSNVPFRVIQ